MRSAEESSRQKNSSRRWPRCASLAIKHASSKPPTAPSILSFHLTMVETIATAFPDPGASKEATKAIGSLILGVAKSAVTMKLDESVLKGATELAKVAVGAGRRQYAEANLQEMLSITQVRSIGLTKSGGDGSPLMLLHERHFGGGSRWELKASYVLALHGAVRNIATVDASVGGSAALDASGCMLQGAVPRAEGPVRAGHGDLAW